MAQICGIYGYEMTKGFAACGMRFVPASQSMQEAELAARDESRYNLTAVVIADDFGANILYRLEAVLSFVEHLDVIVTPPQLLVDGDPLGQFDKTLRVSRRHSGGGAVLGKDTFFPTSRSTFIELALNRLADSTHCESNGYHTLFFKVTESFRQRRPFIEVSYFLLFSGLETYVRKTLNEFGREPLVGALLNRRLRAMGFNVYDFSPSQLKRSMDTYVRLRNKLFHNSAFEATCKNNKGITTTYKLVDYYAHFTILMSLVVLKATDFDDGYIDWDAWINFQ